VSGKEHNLHADGTALRPCMHPPRADAEGGVISGFLSFTLRGRRMVPVTDDGEVLAKPARLGSPITECG
jgi:hypothetical protein